MIPSPKVWSLLRLVKIGTMDLEKKNLKCLQSVFTVSLCIFLGNGRGLTFEQTWILFIQRRICAKFR